MEPVGHTHFHGFSATKTQLFVETNKLFSLRFALATCFGTGCRSHMGKLYDEYGALALF